MNIRIYYHCIYFAYCVYISISNIHLQAPSPAPTPAAAVAAAAAAGSQLKEIGKVIAAYEATGKEQLSLKPNQLIHIKKKSPSGWWEGELMVNIKKAH